MILFSEEGILYPEFLYTAGDVVDKPGCVAVEVEFGD